MLSSICKSIRFAISSTNITGVYVDCEQSAEELAEQAHSINILLMLLQIIERDA